MTIINTLLLEIASEHLTPVTAHLDKLDRLRDRLRRTGEEER